MLAMIAILMKRFIQDMLMAPISWSVKSHVNDGREHLNFSVWGTYNKELKENMLDSLLKPLSIRQCRCLAILFIMTRLNSQRQSIAYSVF
jgi:hypothetical protein